MYKNAFDKYNIIKPYLEKESSLSSLADKNNINLRTLQRWVERYKQKSLQGLDRKKRSDLGKYRKITTELQELIKGLFLHKQNLTIANITRKLNTYSSEHNIPTVNYFIVRKVIRSIPDDLITLARFGDKTYANKYEMVMRRESKYPNQIWQIDHSVLKVKFLNNNIGKDKDYLWLTIIIDDFSRAIMGFHLFTGAPSATHTALALRRAIWYKQDKNWSMCGIPEILYTDHGTDFTSTHIDYVCADLKIQLIHSIIGKPRGRGKVERFFLSLEQKLIEQLKFHDNAYKLEELEELIKNFIINDYNNAIHGTTKETPANLWNKNYIIPQMPESIDRLNLLLLTTRKSRVVQRDGIYFSSLRYFHPNLVAYVGEPITVRFDPSDLSEIWVYEQKQLICKAVCEQYRDQNISYEQLKKIRINRKKELKHEIKTGLVNINSITGVGKKEKMKKEKVTKQTKPKFKLYKNE